jgi:hypothetical protein
MRSHITEGIDKFLLRVLDNNKLTSIAGGAFTGLGSLTRLYATILWDNIGYTFIIHFDAGG